MLYAALRGRVYATVGTNSDGEILVVELGRSGATPSTVHPSYEPTYWPTYEHAVRDNESRLNA